MSNGSKNSTPPSGLEFQSVSYGKYFLLERLAIGGMAEVFKAKTFGVHGFERLLVIKRILPHLCQDDEFVEMFIDEAKISVELSHPNIAQIFDLGKIGDNYFIAMEYIDGKDLRALLKKGKITGTTLTPDQAMFIAIEVCKGLDYAHNKKDSTSGKPLGIVHRDISPQNIMLSYEGAVKIVDFGIAKAESKLSRTQAGVLKGKFGYMSPEQASGLEMTPRTDVFSLGIVFFEMLTGRRLFLGDSDFETLEMIKKASAPPPSSINPAIPKAIDALCLKALEKDPAKRYASAAEFQIELTKYFYQAYSDFTYSNLSLFMKRLFRDEIEQEKLRLSLLQSHLPMKEVVQAEINASRADRLIESTPGRTQDAPSGTVTEPVAAPPKESSSRGSLRESILSGKRKRMDPTSFHRSSGSRRQIEVRGLLRDVPARGGGRKRLALYGAALLGLALLFFLWPSRRSPTPPPVPKGTLIVVSNPLNAEVFVNDASQGFTPLSKEIPAGENYQVAVRKTDFAEWRQTVTLATNAVVKLEPTLLPLRKTSSLYLETDPPGATIVYNGQDSGKRTPAEIDDIPVGPSFTIALKKEGYKNLEKIYVFDEPKSQRKMLKLSPLEKRPPPAEEALLLVTSDPDGAQVSLNGKVMGTTPLALEQLKKGRVYMIAVVKPGYRAATKKVKLERLRQQEAFPLSAAYGYISVNALPWANIIVDGKKIGETPIARYRLPAGRHTLEYSHPDFGSSKEEVTLREGEEKVFMKKLGR